MRLCWNKDPDKRLTFGQLYRTLKQLDKEVQVIYIEVSKTKFHEPSV